MHIRLRPATFGCSPAREALSSLHILANARRRPLHISWALRIREQMSVELKREVERFAYWHQERPLIFGRIWPHAAGQSWDDELAALREAPIDYFTDPFVQAALPADRRGSYVAQNDFLNDDQLLGRALAAVAERHPASLPAMHQLIADPEECREQYVKFLSSYWESCLAADWPRMQARLTADIAQRAHDISQRGLLHVLTEVSPRIQASHDADDVITIRPPDLPPGRSPLEITLGEVDQLLLVPSLFVWPKLVTVMHRDRRPDDTDRLTVTFVYALAEMEQDGRPPVPPADLLQLLRAAADPTRLQILQLVAQRPRSTSELAGLITLTEAAVSKHLRLLQDAGWVAPERHSYYVYYRLVREALASLSQGMQIMLR
jgi:DNA-binding transcriptional ArsR family regulator